MSETNPTLDLLTTLSNSSRTFEALLLFLQSACLPMFSTFLPIHARAIRILPPVRFKYLFPERYFFGYRTFWALCEFKKITFFSSSKKYHVNKRRSFFHRWITAATNASSKSLQKNAISIEDLTMISQKWLLIDRYKRINLIADRNSRRMLK